MNRSKITLSYIFEYFLPHFIEKDTLPVPILLSRLLGIQWVHYTRPIQHIDSTSYGIPIIFVGKVQTKTNSELLLQNKETECTFSNWFMIKSSFIAGLNSTIMMTGHWRGRTCLGGLIFKTVCFFRAKKSFVYIKMDTDPLSIHHLADRKKSTNSFKDRIKYWATVSLANFSVDLFSVESPEALDAMNALFPSLSSKVILVRNCPSVSLLEQGVIPSINRKNQILAVGRLGTFQKATDILLTAYRQFYQKHKNWKLILVGSSNPEFNKMLENYSDLIDIGAINYLGPISDKTKLKKIYLESAIYTMPSRFEGASLSLIEACSFGCVPVCTSVGSAADALGKYFNDLTVNIDDANSLAQKLIEIVEKPILVKQISQYLFEHSKQFRWEFQIQSIINRITQKLNIKMNM